MTEQVTKKQEKGSAITLLHRIKVFDKDGKLKYDSGRKEGKSFVKQFMQVLATLLTDRDLAPTITETGGGTSQIQVKSNWDLTYYPATWRAPTGTSYGIWVGTDDTAPTNTDITLGALIANGSGAGQLNYGIQSGNWQIPASISGNIDFLLTRSLSNNSGGTVTIKEIGITIISGTTSWRYLIARDVLGSPVAVGDSESVVVEYTLRTTI